MKKTWWRVPVYCLAASWICFQLEVRLLLHLAIVTLPDGSISSDNTRSLIVFGTLFLAVLLIGGLVFFKKIGRRELLVSALIMVLMNISQPYRLYGTRDVCPLLGGVQRVEHLYPSAFLPAGRRYHKPLAGVFALSCAAALRALRQKGRGRTRIMKKPALGPAFHAL